MNLILEEQDRFLRCEISEKKQQLESVEYLSRMLKNVSDFSVESIADIAYIMDSRKKMYRLRLTMIILSMICELIEISGIVIWIAMGIWWPYVAMLPATFAIGMWLVVYYLKSVDYICPRCHTVFRPKFREAFFAAHTPTARKLTCTCCKHKGFCIETYRKENYK